MSERGKSERIFYGYVDYTDDGRPFYVGKGLSERIQLKGRNVKHVRVSAKHGRVRVIEYCTENEDACFEWEKVTIRITGTFSSRDTGIGCNFTEGGDGSSGARHSPESVERRAALRRGVPRKPEVCAKISASLTGKKLSLDSIEKRSAKIRGRHLSEEHKAHISKANKGRPAPPRPSPEVAAIGWAKTAMKLRGRPKSVEHRRSLAIANTGKKLSKETREKLSAAQLGRKRGPTSFETREKISSAKRGKKLGPEARASVRIGIIVYHLMRKGAKHTEEVLRQEEVDNAAWRDQERRDQEHQDWLEGGGWQDEEAA